MPFPLGLHQTPLRELSALPQTPYLYLRGLLLMGGTPREEKGGKEGRGRKGRGRREEVEGEIWPTQKFCCGASCRRQFLARNATEDG